MPNQKPLLWKWNGKEIPLYKLKDNQLYFVQNSIKQNKNKVWFGVKSKDWLTEIEKLTKSREKQNIEFLHAQITERRIKKAPLQANGILRMLHY